MTAQVKAEILQNESRALSWHKTRLEAVRAEVKDENCPHYQKGAFFLLHVLPLSDGVVIRPADVERHANTLRPLRRVGAYVGRINHLGYESRTAPEIPAKAYLQVFRTGEVECLRPIWTKLDKTVIDGTFTDAEIVDAASTACAYLAGQRVPLPYLIVATICGIKDWTISSSLQVPIEVDELLLPQVEISRWDQIAKNGSIEPLAQSLHESLNVYWNAGGVAQSMTFDGDRWVLAQRPNF